MIYFVAFTRFAMFTGPSQTKSMIKLRRGPSWDTLMMGSLRAIENTFLTSVSLR